jgi:hypothetical protein
MSNRATNGTAILLSGGVGDGLSGKNGSVIGVDLSSLWKPLTAAAAATAPCIVTYSVFVTIRGLLSVKACVAFYAVAGSIGILVMLVRRHRSQAMPAVLASCAVVLGFALPLAHEIVGIVRVSFSAPESAMVGPEAHDAAPLILERGRVTHADYSRKKLDRARLDGSTLEDVNLSETSLVEADLRRSTFRRVNLAGADLCGADIRGADLRGAEHLELARLDFVLYDKHTEFPNNADTMLLSGLVLDTNSGNMLYSCAVGKTRQLLPDGTRE